MLDGAKAWARRVKLDVIALWVAARDPRTPVLAKIVAGAVAAYALSPIDLIPDFIPVLGYLDDLVIVPLGIMLAVRLIPIPLMTEYRQIASARSERPSGAARLIVIIKMIWFLGALLIAAAVFARWFGR